jgi:hypothetical protein
MISFNLNKLIILLICFSVGCWVFSPIIGAYVIFSLLLLCLCINGGYLFVVFLLLVSVIFINIYKYPDGDIVWYYAHHVWLMNGSLLSYFDLTIEGVQAKYTEPIFHLFSYFSSKIFNADREIFVALIALLIYGLFLISTLLISNKLKLKKVSVFSALVLVLGVGVTFTISTHLVRQLMAAGFLFLSISLFFCNFKRVSFLFSVFAILTHNSIAIMVLMWLSAIYFVYRKFDYKVVYFIIFCFIVNYSSPSFVDFLEGSSDAVLSGDDGVISVFSYLMDVFLFFLVSLLFWLNKKNKKLSEFEVRYVEFVVVFAFIFLFFLNSISISSFLLLRYSFFMDLIRSIMLISLICMLAKISFFRMKFMSVLFLVVALISMQSRINSSTFIYKFDYIDALFPGWRSDV